MLPQWPHLYWPNDYCMSTERSVAHGTADSKKLKNKTKLSQCKEKKKNSQNSFNFDSMSSIVNKQTIEWLNSNNTFG